MIISVEVRFLGIFQRLSGKKRLQLKLEEPVTVRKVVMKLTEMFSSDFERALVDSHLDDVECIKCHVAEYNDIMISDALVAHKRAANNSNYTTYMSLGGIFYNATSSNNGQSKKIRKSLKNLKLSASRLRPAELSYYFISHSLSCSISMPYASWAREKLLSRKNSLGPCTFSSFNPKPKLTV